MTCSIISPNFNPLIPPLSLKPQSNLTTTTPPLLLTNKHIPSQLSHNKFNYISKSRRFSCSATLSTVSVNTNNYDFSDGTAEVELRLHVEGREVRSSKDILMNVDENSLIIKTKSSGPNATLIEINQLFDKIKPGETIWYIDEDQLVVNLKKHDPDLKWPDIMESWKSLTVGVGEILKGTSINIVGDSTIINQKVGQELAIGLGYTPFTTSDLLEAFGKQTIDSWVTEEGAQAVADAEGTVLESLSSHVRTVVSTLGGQHGAARRTDKWRHLYAGFTIWLSQSKATDENSAKEEARRNIQDGNQGYSNAEVVVKLGGWDPDLAQTVSQACLSALKRLILSDKKLPGKKSLYVRLGCRGDWPNINPPGWDPSSTQ